MSELVEYLTPKQVAALLGVSQPCLWKWRVLADGRGPAWHRRGGKILYTRPDVDRYIEQNKKGF